MISETEESYELQQVLTFADSGTVMWQVNCTWPYVPLSGMLVQRVLWGCVCAMTKVSVCVFLLASGIYD